MLFVIVTKTAGGLSVSRFDDSYKTVKKSIIGGTKK